MSAVLVIAGSDSSGGAGLTRDVAVLAHFGCEVVCALTAVTAQSDERLTLVHVVPAPVVRAQIAAACETRRIAAIKVGMLAGADTVQAVVASVPPRAIVPLVLDPVLASSSGGALLDGPGLRTLRSQLLPRTTLLTPNIPEAALLLDCAPALTRAEQERQALALLELGVEAVLLKGGHGTGAEAVDVLATRAAPLRSFAAPRLARTRRGTGCALASGIAAGLAQGLTLAAACARAKRQVSAWLQHGP